MVRAGRSLNKLAKNYYHNLCLLCSKQRNQSRYYISPKTAAITSLTLWLYIYYSYLSIRNLRKTDLSRKRFSLCPRAYRPTYIFLELLWLVKLIEMRDRVSFLLTMGQSMTCCVNLPSGKSMHWTGLSAFTLARRLNYIGNTLWGWWPKCVDPLYAVFIP